MVWIVLIIFGLLGLGVFFAAIRGGPAGARRALHTENRVGQKLVWAGVVILVVFGVAVPAIVLASNGENKASVGPSGIHLDAAQQTGRDLFQRSCAVCHTLSATKSVGRIGPNLDVRVGVDIATPAGRKALIPITSREGHALVLGQMPALLYQGKEAQEVASFVAAVAGH
jgi:mono/diheme cytochrome c family protein